MASSVILHRVALVRTDVSEELIAYIIRVERIGELGTTLAVTSNGNSLRRNNDPEDRGYDLLWNVVSYKYHATLRASLASYC
jgi:hypothetical protein